MNVCDQGALTSCELATTHSTIELALQSRIPGMFASCGQNKPIMQFLPRTFVMCDSSACKKLIDFTDVS